MTVHQALFEIGVEELPASFVQGALEAFPELASKRLSELRLRHGALRALGTPRRLALLIEELADRQEDVDEEVMGPPVSAAFDKSGAPTKAAEAFARKNGVAIGELRRVTTPKGDYVVTRRKELGQPASALLGEALEAIARQLPFRKTMRWGNGEGVPFGRPVRWLVALLDEHVLPMSFAGCSSDRVTCGHRFLAPEALSLAHPKEYVDKLREAHVLVDPQERQARMLERLRARASEIGASLIEDDFLVRENRELVEEPEVILGRIDASFLELPEEVILEVARSHQRYFGLRAPDGSLAGNYLAVVNTALAPENIRAGNDRVMRARLSDARFFLKEDQATSLESRAPKLHGIVFHNRLGTVGAKVKRLGELLPWLASHVHEEGSLATALRGAALAKSDLVTLMVGEFPELQGSMGRAYALHDGEPQEVADVIRDHYRPRGASDEPAPSPASALVALADRLDTLAGCFAIGLSSTGATDPFALRRACITTLRTLLHHQWRMDLLAAFSRAYRVVAEGTKLDLDEASTTAKLGDFFRERLRNLLAESLPGDVIDAALAVAAHDPVDARARALALAKLDPAARDKIVEVLKRAWNITKEAPEGSSVPPSTLESSPHPTEQALFDALGSLDTELTQALAVFDYQGALARIAAVAPLLDRYFTDIFVMTDVQPLRENRLRMLRQVRDSSLQVAHFHLLQRGGEG